MFHPVPVYVGLRYVVSRHRGFFVSFISWISMLGICVGVAALITVISVMNGLERETRAAGVSSWRSAAVPMGRIVKTLPRRGAAGYAP